MRALPRSRGTTLVELLIVVAITLIVLAGAIVAANSQQRTYLDGTRLRSAQGSGRRAVLALEQALPRAGDGIDPTLAFDFSGWTGSGPCPSEMGGCPVDTTSNSDEVIFLARDPKYWVSSISDEDPAGNAWRIQGVTNADVTIYGRAGDRFRAGQIFVAVCPKSSTYTYFTSDQTTDPLPADHTVTVTLKPVAAANPFRRQDLAVGVGCFNASVNAARLFLVNRYRYHVRPVPMISSSGITQYDPVLVLDRGIDLTGPAGKPDGRVDAFDEELVAEGIESMQVGYGFYDGSIAEAGSTGGSPISLTTGAAGTAGNTITLTPFSGASPYASASFFGYTFGPPPAQQRRTNAQANIQYVRISLVARSTELDVQSSGSPGAFVPTLNQDTLPTWVTNYATPLGRDGYQRIRFETTVSLPSMSNRAMTYF